MNFKAIVLAAGKGTRMKSKYPKVVHKVCGKEMVNHVVDTATKSGINEVIVVLGHKSDVVKESLNLNCSVVLQKEQLGTGHAVLQAKDLINDKDTILILYGDTPLVKEDTLKKLLDFHLNNNYSATVLTTCVSDPYGYGRVIRDKEGFLYKIVEQKDASEEEKLISEINSGIFCFNGGHLKNALNLLNNDNAKGEYYLTDTVKIFRDKGKKVGIYNGSTIDELMGINSRVQLEKAEKMMRKRINEYHMLNGVTMLDSDSIYIETNVKIGCDTIIYPGVVLKGKTSIGEDCTIGMNSRIVDSTIGNCTEIMNSTILSSVVGRNTKVGPYAYLRPNAELGDNVKIGDFVEVKNSKIGDDSKASHLAYIGDAEVGKEVNIGCGVVFVNYDGKNKFKSIVKDGAFIGSNSNLVSPVTVEEKGYIATGSTITDDVPKSSLAIARSRQVVKEGWVDKKKKNK